MNLTKKMGDKGEDLTAKYLRERGFIITKRNFHSRYGEIDIIAENAQYILFVEVKTRKNNAFVSGFSAVDIHKRRKIIAKEKRCDGVELQVNARNANAKVMYEKYGFTEKSINMELL